MLTVFEWETFGIIPPANDAIPFFIASVIAAVNCSAEKLGINPTLYLNDGVKLVETPDSFADMVMTCPPYFDIEKYEE